MRTCPCELTSRRCPGCRPMLTPTACSDGIARRAVRRGGRSSCTPIGIVSRSSEPRRPCHRQQTRLAAERDARRAKHRTARDIENRRVHSSRASSAVARRRMSGQSTPAVMVRIARGKRKSTPSTSRWSSAVSQARAARLRASSRNTWVSPRRAQRAASSRAWQVAQRRAVGIARSRSSEIAR